MGARQEFFKEELAGSIHKRIFKAQLKGESMVVSPRMRLIIPLRKFSSVHTFLAAIRSFDGFDWSHNRGRDGSLHYNGHPVAEHITDESFYLWDDWQVYYQQRNFVKLGWIEMNGKKQVENAFNYFIPLGLYGKGDYIEVQRKGGEINTFPLPEYDENAKGDNGFHVDTTNARVVQYKNDKADFCVNLDHLTGMPMENFGLRGNCVRFPARQA
jgi:hypothetical protein